MDLDDLIAKLDPAEQAEIRRIAERYTKKIRKFGDLTDQLHPERRSLIENEAKKMIEEEKSKNFPKGS